MAAHKDLVANELIKAAGPVFQYVIYVLIKYKYVVLLKVYILYCFIAQW